MKKNTELKPFLGHLVNLIAKGYIHYKIVKIPPKKMYKIDKILKKIENEYKTNLTRSQRAYAKKKGYANLQAVQFRDIVVILHTNGLVSNEIDLGNGFVCFKEKNALRLNVSDYLSVIIFKDERNKITVRLSKETLQDFKSEVIEAFKTQNGRRFHNTLKRFKGLPLFRGIIKQKKDIRAWILDKQKDYQRKKNKWNIPTFL